MANETREALQRIRLMAKDAKRENLKRLIRADIRARFGKSMKSSGTRGGASSSNSR